MEFLKDKSDLTIKVCFTAKELANLLLTKDHSGIVDIATQNINYSKKVKKIFALSSKTANSSEYEYFVALFSLYELFDKKCKFCFNLKNSFNYSTDKIVTIDDLKKYKNDPPDIIVKDKNNLYDFELKRYRGVLNVNSVFDFLSKNIFKHYSSHDRNYLVILQMNPYSKISSNIFQELHDKLCMNDFGLKKLAFYFNSNNQKMIIVSIWPKLYFVERPFIPHIQLLQKIINN